MNPATLAYLRAVRDERIQRARATTDSQQQNGRYLLACGFAEAIYRATHAVADWVVCTELVKEQNAVIDQEAA